MLAEDIPLALGLGCKTLPSGTVAINRRRRPYELPDLDEGCVDQPYFLHGIRIIFGKFISMPLERGPDIVPPRLAGGRDRHWSKAANPDGHRSLVIVHSVTHETRVHRAYTVTSY
jgi:hypothetical protein